ncbi:MAG: hypothetical protein IH919_01780 [Deltaproteobacteria bacterium]|nr:hypothetical protein [Deltaproteobacteria bacterium]
MLCWFSALEVLSYDEVLAINQTPPGVIYICWISGVQGRAAPVKLLIILELTPYNLNILVVRVAEYDVHLMIQMLVRLPAVHPVK